jgi:CBS domain-containing protein
MKARDVMTTRVVSVGAEASTRDIARLLDDNHISAVPVVDQQGRPVGMVSEGDLVGRDQLSRAARREWWLTLLAEGETLSPVFLASLKSLARPAREVMTAPVVAVDEGTDIAEIAHLLIARGIKRVPVLRDGRIVGIVSRADLVGALAENATV